jgi:hypothetical protein
MSLTGVASCNPTSDLPPLVIVPLLSYLLRTFAAKRCGRSGEVENVPGVFFAPYAGEGESNPAENESPLWQGVSAPVILLSGDGHVASM